MKFQTITPYISLRLGALAMAAIIITAPTNGDEYRIDWHTIDGGGTLQATGSGFTLSGAFGQSDAGSAAAPLAGDGYTLVGGFWSLPLPAQCLCPADVNNDQMIDGADIQSFVACALGVGSNCGCADIAEPLGTIDASDVTAFVAELLSNSGCP